MRKKIKKIATGGIVGTLLFVSSGSVRAQDTTTPTRLPQRNEILDTDIQFEDQTQDEVGVSAYDDMYSESRQTLLEQGFSPSQIQKLNRRD